MIYPTTLFSHKNFVTVALSLLMLTSSASFAESSGSDSAQTGYIGIDGPMIVNVLSRDSIHFLQVTAEFKLKDPAMASDVQTHMGPIKHHLIMLLSEKKFYELQSIDGKRKLREEALQVVQNVLKEKTGDTMIENIFFTSLVVQ